MRSSAIRQLRRKFILIAMMSFFVVIMFTGGMAALSNETSLRMQAGHVLELIVENDGELPERVTRETNDRVDERVVSFFRSLSPEFTYGARFFSVVFDKDGGVKKVNVQHVASVDSEQAVEYARIACDAYVESLTVSILDMGVSESFYFKVRENDAGEKTVAFLDCSFQQQVSRQVFWNTLFVCGIGLIGSFVLVLLLSNRAIQPEIENARRQKQFITNASHELKTPLSVIRANTEVIEMLEGESEWTRSTMSQVDRMDGLVQNLVMIARAEEREDRTSLGEIDVGKVVGDSVAPFRALAVQEHKELVYTASEDVHMVADASAIQQLSTLLVDNALKYCDKEGTVLVEVDSPRRKMVRLTVSNSFADGKNAQFAKYFERFYRDDESHSNEGGYGIGLSVAESICVRYGGSIKAHWKNGMAVFTCQLQSV